MSVTRPEPPFMHAESYFGYLCASRLHTLHIYQVFGCAHPSGTVSGSSRPNLDLRSAVAKPAHRLSPICSNGRRISRGCSSIRDRAASAVNVSGCTVPDLMEGAERLNQSFTGILPKKRRKSAVVQGSVNKLRAMTVYPAARKAAFCRALPPQPGFSKKIISI